MGCCNNEKCCSADKKQPRRIPWLAAVLVGLGVLIAVNWH